MREDIDDWAMALEALCHMQCGETNKLRNQHLFHKCLWNIIPLTVYGRRKDWIVPRFGNSGYVYIILVNIVALHFVSWRHYVAIICKSFITMCT